MFGFILKFMIVVVVLIGAAILFEFRWTGEELRIRNRFSTQKAAVESSEMPNRAKEEIPESSRKQLHEIIEESSK